MLNLKLQQLGAALKALTKRCKALTARHNEEATAAPSADSAGDDAEKKVRWEELIQERDELSARVTAQQELLCQLSEVNQRQISELVRLKGRHRALCRISPGVELPLKPADAKSVFVASQGVSTLLLKSQPALGYRTKSSVPGAANKVQAFDFDRVYGENATTQEIYAQLKDLTPSVLCGNTLSVVVLGPRMSGKTLTLFFPLSQPCASDDATRRNPRSEGLVVHYLHHLFELIKEKCLLAPREGSTDVKLSCTCVEVHNEVLLDAFDPHPRTDRLKPDAVKNARTGSLRVTNLRTLGDDFAADSVAALSEDNPLLQSILDELRSALMRRHEASRQSHVVFTTCVEVTDRAMGLHHEGKLVLAMLADSSDPTLKPPFDASAANCRSSASSASQDNAPAATHLTNRAVSCLGKIIKARKAARGMEIGEEVFKESKLTRIMEDCFRPTALNVLLFTVRNDSLRLSAARFYAEMCALARR